MSPAAGHPPPDDALTGAVLSAFYRVYNALGYGHFESVYANALGIELAKRGIPFVREAPVTVTYDGQAVGLFRSDYIVEDKIILELKATPRITSGDRAQLLSYLKASGMTLGLLLHFGPEPDARRIEL
jgi:GxxExxY protein